MDELEIIEVDQENLFFQYKAIRYEVFTVEKQVPVCIEVDQYDCLDSICDHYLIRYQKENIGAIRIKKGKNCIYLQRFCLIKAYRNQGIGKYIIGEIENIYKKRFYYQIQLDAKYEVYEFYKKCGYLCVSEKFLEASIPHIKMQKELLEIKEYDDLPQEAIDLRTEIFIKEQGFQDEFDQRDRCCRHLVIFENKLPIATCRYFYEHDHFILGRIAVKQAYRHQKIGTYMIDKVCHIIKEGEIVLHAQLQAKQFYEKLGFYAYGEIEYEEHCPHIWMKKSCN
ncbi:MAG: GNAT family N-acetyltransferase [Faecalibacillus sp.]